jgi:hypothetical protein
MMVAQPNCQLEPASRGIGVPCQHIEPGGRRDIYIGPKMVGPHRIGPIHPPISVRLAKIEQDETCIIAPAALIAADSPLNILLSQALHVHGANSTFNVP